MPYTKDEQRISDIRSKANGNVTIMRRLATTQANRITDIPKSRRRYYAALELLGRMHVVTVVFERRYNELTGNSVPATTVTRTEPIDNPNVSVDIPLTNKPRSKEDKKKNLEALKEKISTGKKENSVDDYIAFFRK